VTRPRVRAYARLDLLGPTAPFLWGPARRAWKGRRLPPRPQALLGPLRPPCAAKLGPLTRPAPAVLQVRRRARVLNPFRVCNFPFCPFMVCFRVDGQSGSGVYPLESLLCGIRLCIRRCALAGSPARVSPPVLDSPLCTRTLPPRLKPLLLLCRCGWRRRQLLRCRRVSGRGWEMLPRSCGRLWCVRRLGQRGRLHRCMLRRCSRRGRPLLPHTDAARCPRRVRWQLFLRIHRDRSLW
jgi:hypothetical protein